MTFPWKSGQIPLLGTKTEAIHGSSLGTRRRGHRVTATSTGSATGARELLHLRTPHVACQAYKAEAQVDVVCPNGLRTWVEIQEAIRLIPGPVVPLIPADLSPYPSLQAQQDAGAAAAWFPALTTMAGLQANWDFLSDFQQRSTLALDALRAQAARSPWGVTSNGRILDESRLRSMEKTYLPD